MPLRLMIIIEKRMFLRRANSEKHWRKITIKLIYYIFLKVFIRVSSVKEIIIDIII